jgi:NAD(P)-dependent dehydrogenase (short-subunit alcohol dehydrogenase family)
MSLQVILTPAPRGASSSFLKGRPATRSLLSVRLSWSSVDTLLCLSGIGLETVRQLARDTDVRVVAAARNPTDSEDLQKIVAGSEGHRNALDVASEKSISVRPELASAYSVDWHHPTLASQAAVKETRELSFVKDNAS